MSTITATVQLRRDTAANWTANNPTLLAGELGFETDTKRAKLGDGVTAWNSLAYIDPSWLLNDSVTNAKLANMAQATIKGRQAGSGTGDPEDLTASQARTALGLGTAALVNTGTGSGDVPTITQADARYTLKNTSVDTVAILPPSLVEWVNMPAALTFFAGQNRWVVPMDLTAKTECKLHVTMGATPGAAGCKLRLLYRTQAAGYSTTITDYVTIGTSEVQVTMGTGSNALFSTAWIPLVAGAKDNVIVAVAGLDGDGAADPRFLNIYLETR